MDASLKEIKVKITSTEIALKDIEKFVIKKIREIGTTKAASLIGKTKQYLNNCINGNYSISHKQILDIAKKII